MEINTVQEILRTREQIARNSGNATELSLILELLKISKEYKELKQQGNENSIVNYNRWQRIDSHIRILNAER